MPTKEELLNSLKISQLIQLAKSNRVKLVIESHWGFGSAPAATRKEDIIEVLIGSGKITKKKIEVARKPSKPQRELATKRKAFRAAEKSQILKRQKYKCAICKKIDLTRTVPHFDHKKPLALGGSDTLRNIQGLCGTCHSEKTREDRLKISKAKKRR